MRQALADAQQESSVLAHFDAGDVLDALSMGIVVLDSHLCPVYANVMAEYLLAFQAERVRGRPLASFLPQSQRFLEAAERALHKGEVVAFGLAVCTHQLSDRMQSLDLRVALLRDQLSGRHLLLELRVAQPSSDVGDEMRGKAERRIR